MSELTTSSESKRKAWPDLMKCVAIYLVYLAHTRCFPGKGELAFQHDYDIAVFFFCSGFFALRHLDKGFWENLWRNFRRLMFPYFFFSVLGVIPLKLFCPDEVGVLGLLARMLAGMRDHLIAAALWFLPAMFCCAVMFDVLRRCGERLGSGSVTFRNVFLLAASLVLWANAGIVRPLTVIGGKEWFALPWSIDCSMEFMPFYVLGALTFPIIDNFQFSTASVKGRTYVVIGSVLAISYTVACIFHPNLNVCFVPNYAVHPFYNFAIRSIQSVPIVFAFVVVAKLWNKSCIISKIGTQTLLLCCTEFFSASLLMWIFKACHYDMPLTHLNGFLLCAVRLLVAYFVFVPIFRPAMPYITLDKIPFREKV